MKVIPIYAACWLGMVILAIVNGAIREKLYGPFMRELSAHQLSTLIGMTLLGVYIWILTGIVRIESPKQAVIIGCMWFIMTIGFEFAFGHFVIGHTWERLFHDYNLVKGRVWLLVLIWTTVAPYIFYRARS
ncbi:MAG: hypothetical protein JW932_06245 [Deltaproteobacteria bacterium]|nr:hypothetical protein [Deltaproteobacteria bacterium]